MGRSSRRTLFLVVLILLSCGFLGMVFAQKNPAAAPGGDSDVRDSLRQFATVYDVVEQNYAEPVNADKAIYNGAIPGMLHVLDPHSNFFDPKAYSLRATIKSSSSPPLLGPLHTGPAFVRATLSSRSMANRPIT